MQRIKNSEIKLCPFNELKGLLNNGGTARVTAQKMKEYDKRKIKEFFSK